MNRADDVDVYDVARTVPATSSLKLTGVIPMPTLPSVLILIRSPPPVFITMSRVVWSTTSALGRAFRIDRCGFVESPYPIQPCSVPFMSRRLMKPV